MLALLSEMPVDEGDYGFEYKWDGIRGILYWDGMRMRLESRNLIDMTDRYHEVRALSKALGKTPIILDGEIVALNPEGVSDFSLLQTRFGQRRENTAPLYYMLFDILHWNGHSTLSLPYVERRSMLDRLKLHGPAWQTPPFHPAKGSRMMDVARERGYEGIIAKRLESPYEPGRRSGAWRKIKLVKRQEFVIGGWLPRQTTMGTGIRSLMLGYYGSTRKKAPLKYAGNVGSGFREEERVRFRQALEKIGQKENPFDERVPDRDAVFVQPRLVAEIEFRGWTHDNHLRQPVLKGLRFDKTPTAVTREA